MLSEVEVRCCRRLKSDAVGGPMLSEVEVRRCRRPKKCTCRLARMRANKENSDFYKKAFELMFQFCHKDYPQFQIDKTLKGTWSIGVILSEKDSGMPLGKPWPR